MPEESNSLYVVGTPIGNLEDITLRALRVLKEVGLIAAEDTRVTRKLLQRYEISTPLTSYHEHNKLSKLPELLNALSQHDIALVSDAGMPGINDPGHELVRAVREAGYGVAAIPGPSALTTAISVSGLPVEQFVYLGFLPRRKTERTRLLESLTLEKRALVAFETRHRLKAGLQDVLTVLGDRRISVCRELTKLHEEVFRGTIQQALEYFDMPRGEFTLVIEGSSEADNPKIQDLEEAAKLVHRLKIEGVKAKSGVSQVVELTGLPRKEAYRLWIHDRADVADENPPAGD